MRVPDHLTGGCQCGACRYEISAAPMFGYVCHCLECRRHTSGAFSASVMVAADALQVTGPVATWIRDDGENPVLEAHLCPTCGVRLFHQSVPAGDVVRVKIGTLDDSDWFEPAAEFFTKRRFGWVHIGGETVECRDRAEDFAALGAAWQRLVEAG